jgi:hypothetical protein
MSKIKLVALATLALSLTACGYKSRDTEAVGQVKRVFGNTPLLCPDYYAADLSLGVMRNGSGSMSGQDIGIVINKHDLEVTKKAAETGDIVKITYDMERVAFCTEGRIATKVEVVSK